jgi:16S rRNA (uracil1498-N3)-methyltransferase
MALPFFYIPDYLEDQQELALDEDNSRHIVQVLRMKAGERMQLTDGKGNLLAVRIVVDHKKKCVVKVEGVVKVTSPQKKIHIGISLLKNANRFEWFLEKATEIGVSQVIPLLCERTEKQHFRQERMQALLISAMLQSQQCWLPDLGVPIPFPQIVEGSREDRKYIAHCAEDTRRLLTTAPWSASESDTGAGSVTGSSLILIGPEGDFSQKEVNAAREQGFIPVSLGETRLRSETAGVVAATLLSFG